jgi:hypothetical protein
MRSRADAEGAAAVSKAAVTAHPLLQRVVRLTPGGPARDDSQEPKGHIAVGPHWVRFDRTRWNNEASYREKLRRLHVPLKAPAMIHGSTPVGLDLDQVDDYYTISIRDERGSVGQHSDGIRHLIVSNTHQTGDVPHIAAAMVHDPMIDVLILVFEGQDAIADDMERTYTNAVRTDVLGGRGLTALHVGSSRIRRMSDTHVATWDHQTAETEKTETAKKEGKREEKEEKRKPRAHSWYAALIPKSEWYGPVGPPGWRSEDPRYQEVYTYIRSDGIMVEYKMMYVGGATSLVAEAYRELSAPGFFFEANKEALGSADVEDDDVYEFIGKQYGIDLRPGAERERYLLVWSRYSGRKQGGYNPAGDSSVLGNTQLIKEVGSKTKRRVITIGHDPPSPSTKKTPTGEVHLGEFWTNPAQGNPFLGKGRPGQTNFYYLLARRHDVVQVGQKTGGMDNAALVGMRTVYLEDADSPQRFRMQKWVDAMPHYKGALLTEPPKRVAKAIRYYERTVGQKVPPISHRQGDAFDTARGLREGRTKGYLEDDLELIVKTVRSFDD